VPIWLLTLIIILATHRVTRIITRDALPIVAIPREAFAQRWATFMDAKTKDEKRQSIGGKKTNIFMSSIAYLWECDWCTSVYVGAGLTYAAYVTTSLGDQHWYISVLVALTASSCTGLIAQREPS
jgi:hypothetical protein